MWNIIIGAIFIIGGISGKLALRGTNSTIGIAVFGAVLLVWGLIQVSGARSSTYAPMPRRRRTPGVRPGRPSRPLR